MKIRGTKSEVIEIDIDKETQNEIAIKVIKKLAMIEQGCFVDEENNELLRLVEFKGPHYSSERELVGQASQLQIAAQIVLNKIKEDGKL